MSTIFLILGLSAVLYVLYYVVESCFDSNEEDDDDYR